MLSAYGQARRQTGFLPNLDPPLFGPAWNENRELNAGSYPGRRVAYENTDKTSVLVVLGLLPDYSSNATASIHPFASSFFFPLPRYIL